MLKYISNDAITVEGKNKFFQNILNIKVSYKLHKICNKLKVRTTPFLKTHFKFITFWLFFFACLEVSNLYS